MRSLDDHVFAIDLDGVLFRTEDKIKARLRNRWGIIMSDNELSFDVGRLTANPEANMDLVQQFHDPAFYLNIDPIEGAYRALLDLSRHGKIVAITSRPERTRNPTFSECQRCFPNLIKHIAHVCGTKQLSNGRIVPKGEAQVTRISGEGLVASYRIMPKADVARRLGVTHAVDDNLTEAKNYAKRRIYSYLVTKPYNCHEDIRETIWLQKTVSIAAMVETYLGDWNLVTS